MMCKTSQDASGALLLPREGDSAVSKHFVGESLPSHGGETNETTEKMPDVNAEKDCVSSVVIMLESTAVDCTSKSNGSLLLEEGTNNVIASTTKSNDSTSIRTEQTVHEPPAAAVSADFKPNCPKISKNNVDGVQMMYDSVISLPANENNINPSGDSSNKFQPKQLYSNDGVSSSPVGSPRHSSLQPQVHLCNSNLSEEIRCSPEPYSHVSAAHEILNSFIALNPTLDRHNTPSPKDNERNTASPTMGGKGSLLLTLAERIDDDDRCKPSSATSNSSRQLSNDFVRKQSQHVIPAMNSRDLENLNSNTSENSMSSSTKKSCSSTNNSLTGSYDKKKLNERLRQRLAERNQRTRERSNSDKMVVNTQPESDQRTLERSGVDSQYVANKAAFDAFVVKYGISPTGNAFPDTVSFDEDNQNETLLSRRSFRKSSSEAGTTPTQVVPRPTIMQVPPPHGIGRLHHLFEYAI